jgi:hypothetical protein
MRGGRGSPPLRPPASRVRVDDLDNNEGDHDDQGGDHNDQGGTAGTTTTRGGQQQPGGDNNDRRGDNEGGDEGGNNGNDPAPTPSLASHCSWGGSRVLAANDEGQWKGTGQRGRQQPQTHNHPPSRSQMRGGGGS